MSVDFRFPVLATVALGAGPWLLWRGFRHMATARLIENTPTARVRSMAMGLVEVHGRACGRSLLTAPFSGRPCVHWEVDIAIRGRRSSYSTVHRNQSGQPFFLEDVTGIALVYPQGAESRLHFGVEEEVFGLVPPSPYAEYLAQHPGAISPVARLSMVRFRERLLEEGQQVYVLGTAMPRSQARVVTEWAEEATGTDDWRSPARRSRDEQVCAVIRRGEHDRTFILSQDHEALLTAGLKLKAGAMILGGPPLALLGLGYWLLALAKGRLPG